MIYSVYNYGTRQYDYYMGGRQAGAHAPTPRKRLRAGLGGATPEQAAWKLPAGARHVGAGEQARGLIAVSGIIGDATTGFEFVGVGLLAFVLWKVFA